MTRDPDGHDVIELRDSVDGVGPADLRGFWVGWPDPPSSETHLRILRAADLCVIAVEPSTGRVVGFVTVLTDGILTAYIPNLEVVPEFQGRGIGTALMRRVLERLDGLYAVDLMADPDVQPFYERLGMRPATGMVLRDYERQAGRRS